jgi:hypothetical protein
MRREDAKLLEMIFSHFTKKLRMGKPDGKLLQMLVLMSLMCFAYINFISLFLFFQSGMNSSKDGYITFETKC